MWKKFQSLLRTPFQEAGGLFSLSYKFQKHIWKRFPWRIVRLVAYSSVSALLAYAGQAFIALLVNKLVGSISDKQIDLSSVLPYFIALLVALILPRAIQVAKNYHEMQDWRLFDLWLDEELNRKTANLDFSYHDDVSTISLVRKIRDNIYRLKNFYSRIANIFE